MRTSGQGQFDHAGAVFGGCSGLMDLERLHAGWRKQNSIEFELSQGRFGHAQMTVMRWIESAAQNTESHAVSCVVRIT